MSNTFKSAIAPKGMDFKLNEEQQLLIEAIHEFTEAEIAPIAAELDETERKELYSVLEQFI